MNANQLCRALVLGASLLFAVGCATTDDGASGTPSTQSQAGSTYEEQEIVTAVADFFGYPLPGRSILATLEWRN